MKKPEGYEQSQAFTGEFKQYPMGGQICKIRQAKVDETSTHKEVLIILFDIEEGEFKGFYKADFDERSKNNEDAKWRGIYRQLTEGSSLPYFKGMITAIENSNPGYKWNWDESSLKGKLFGGVFGQEEYEADGKVKLRTVCRFIRSVEQVRKGIDTPEIKRLPGNNGQSFSGFPAFDDDDLPF